MTTVTISPKFQIVIPKAIREQLALWPGQKVEAIPYDDRIVLIPVRRMKDRISTGPMTSRPAFARPDPSCSRSRSSDCRPPPSSSIPSCPNTSPTW